MEKNAALATQQKKKWLYLKQNGNIKKKASRSPLQMFPQRNNPYCDLLIYCSAKVGKITL